MRRFVRIILFILAAAVLALYFFRSFQPGGGDTPAARLLPDLPAYRTVEGQSITGYIGALSEGAALLAGQPQAAVTIAVLDSVIGCYQEVGGVRARVYSHAERPLEAGLVVVADESVVNNPETLFQCVTPAALDITGAESAALEPCAQAYVLTREDGTFYILYAASVASTCFDFCSQLEGCTLDGPAS
jgi:hypothetical protein